jgi:hypothetical protein
MPTLVIEGAAPWDGRYEFSDFGFTNRELYRIKQLSGIRAGELIEALEANDTSAYVGVAMVVLGRVGKMPDPDTLWNANVGSIVIDLDGGVADPPTPPDSGGETSDGDGSSGSSSSPDGD